MYAYHQPKAAQQQIQTRNEKPIQKKEDKSRSSWESLNTRLELNLANAEEASSGDPIQLMAPQTASPLAETRQTPNRTGLPNHMKSNLESMSGFDMSDVRVHYNSPKPASIGALAYTQGNQIYMGPGQNQHLGHEAWHVVQQKQGRVKANTQFKGMEGNEDQGLEREATRYGCEINKLTPILQFTKAKEFVIENNKAGTDHSYLNNITKQSILTSNVIQCAGHDGVMIFSSDGKYIAKRVEQNEYNRYLQIMKAQTTCQENGEGESNNPEEIKMQDLINYMDEEDCKTFSKVVETTNKPIDNIMDVIEIMIRPLKAKEEKQQNYAKVYGGYKEPSDFDRDRYGFLEDEKTQKFLRAANDKQEHIIVFENVKIGSGKLWDLKLGTSTVYANELVDNKHKRDRSSAIEKKEKMDKIDINTGSRELGIRDSDHMRAPLKLTRLFFGRKISTLRPLSIMARQKGYKEGDRLIMRIDQMIEHIQESPVVYVAASVLLSESEDKDQERLTLVDLAHPIYEGKEDFADAKEGMLLGLQNLRKVLLQELII